MLKFTVITINYNNINGLKRTIDSVKRQNYKNFEFIVKDGFSIDGSIQLIQDENCISKYIISNDSGIYEAFNIAIECSRGAFILFLNSGDVLLNEDSLCELALKVKLGSKVDIYYWDGLINRNKFYYMRNLQIKSHIWYSFLGHSGMCLIKRELFNIIGYYNVNLKYLGDREFFYRSILKNNVKTKKIDGFYSRYDISGISNSQLFNDRRRIERLEIDKGYYKYKPVKFSRINELFVKLNKAFRLIAIKKINE
jgi:glycosyltransferase involved in cell wall biosynthesis